MRCCGLASLETCCGREARINATSCRRDACVVHNSQISSGRHTLRVHHTEFRKFAHAPGCTHAQPYARPLWVGIVVASRRHTHHRKQTQAVRRIQAPSAQFRASAQTPTEENKPKCPQHKHARISSPQLCRSARLMCSKGVVSRHPTARIVAACVLMGVSPTGPTWSAKWQGRMQTPSTTVGEWPTCAMLWCCESSLLRSVAGGFEKPTWRWR